MKDFFRNNGALILVIAVLLAAITAVSSYVLQGVPNPLANVLGVITTPIRNGISSFAGWAEGIYNYSFQYDELQAENARLRKEIAELEAKAREGEADSKENERLRTLLGLRQKRREFDFESATVTAMTSSNWESTLTISKGSDFGVALNDCVVTETGALVGVVSEVGTNWATVSTIINTDIEMGGIVTRTYSAGVLEGDFSLMSQGLVKLNYLPEEAQLVAGDEVVTSGKGDVYPSGLVVGQVEGVFTDPSGMTRYAVVLPDVKLDSLVEVFVIKDFDIVE